ELALEQLGGDAGTVERDEGPAPLGVMVDRLGEELLSGAGLALDEHRRIRRGDPPDHLVDLLHRGGPADDQLVALLELAAKPLEVARQVRSEERRVGKEGEWRGACSAWK